MAFCMNRVRWLLLAASAVLLASGGAVHAQSTGTLSDPTTTVSPSSNGPIRLRQPGVDNSRDGTLDSSREGTRDATRERIRPDQSRERSRDDKRRDDRRRDFDDELPFGERLSEFEQYVNRLAAPVEIRRLGSDLMVGAGKPGQVVEYSPLVPPDYLISPGDELVLSMWGSVDAELRLVVDRTGRISVPRAGTIMVAGIRYADLPATISQRMAQVFKNFQLSVSLGQLRGVRVYVTGFVARPGAYTVSGLSSMANALVLAGGPSASGSFRNIQLRRGRELVSTLDFYDLLLNGDRANDKLVQADDVIHVGPVGTQIAVIGSVNRPAIYELKPGETVVDLQRMTGGFSAVADRTRFSLERVEDRATVRVTQVEMSQAACTRGSPWSRDRL
jgi:protein involved in polysaccharide export with SLBB domain